MSATNTAVMPLPTMVRGMVSGHREPLKLGGFLDQFKCFDITPTIGREYCGVNLKEWLEVIPFQFPSVRVFVCAN